jgi:hypothetical protein
MALWLKPGHFYLDSQPELEENIATGVARPRVLDSRMKIISESADELVLQEGSASGITAGVLLIAAGGLSGYFGSRPTGIWVALALVAIGIVVILFSSSITVNANRASGQLLYQKKRLIGARNTAYAISDILRIETRKRWLVENQPNANQGAAPPPQKLVTQSVIIFKDGRELPLDHQKTSQRLLDSSVVLVGQGVEGAMASHVADFLRVPFQEIAPPSFGGGLQINIG